MPKLTIHTHNFNNDALTCSCGRTAKQARKELTQYMDEHPEIDAQAKQGFKDIREGRVSKIK